MTVRVTVLAWFRSREPEGWDHQPPEVHAFDTRAAADAFIERERAALARYNERRAQRGLYAYRTSFDIEDVTQ